MKREYTDCIEYLMSYELPLQKVKDELAWAVQYDLSKSVMCLLTAGAPHGLRVLAPWTATIPRAHSSWDYGLPLSYYVVMRGWQVPALHLVLSKGWTNLQETVASARDSRAVQVAIAAIIQIKDTEPDLLKERSKPYQASLLHLAVYAGSVPLLEYLLDLGLTDFSVDGGDCFKRTPLVYAACGDRTQAMDSLIKHKADVNAQDTFPLTFRGRHGPFGLGRATTLKRRKRDTRG